MIFSSKAYQCHDKKDDSIGCLDQLALWPSLRRHYLKTSKFIAFSSFMAMMSFVNEGHVELNNVCTG